MDPQRYADKLLSEAIERGEFDLPGKQGEPLGDLSADPDWWVRALLEREQLPGRRSRFAAHREAGVRAAIDAQNLAEGRSILARVNADTRRWNEAVPSEYRFDEYTEVWLVDQRAGRPVE